MIEVFILVLTGLFVGFLAGLFGIGGGLIIVPAVTYILIFFHNITPDIAYSSAIASSMISIIFTGSVATFFNIRNQNFEFRLINKTIFPVAIGALAGGLIINIANFYFLKFFFIFYCFLSALKLLSSKNILKPIYSFSEKIIFTVFGLISSIVGIGGGTLFVPYFENNHMDIRKSVSGSSFIGVIVGLSTIISFIIQNILFNNDYIYSEKISTLSNVYMPSFIFLTLPSLISIYFSTKLLITISKKKVKYYFALLLVFIGAISIFNF